MRFLLHCYSHLIYLHVRFAITSQHQVWICGFDKWAGVAANAASSPPAVWIWWFERVSHACLVTLISSTQDAEGTTQMPTSRSMTSKSGLNYVCHMGYEESVKVTLTRRKCCVKLAELKSHYGWSTLTPETVQSKGWCSQGESVKRLLSLHRDKSRDGSLIPK